MEEEGIVSLWVGNALTLEALEEYITPRYGDSGERIPPVFAEDFSLGRFDDDLREAEVIDEPAESLQKLLEGFSYDEIIVPRFVDAYGDQISPPANAVVLLYDYSHEPNAARHRNSPVVLRYVGSVSYFG